MLKNLKKFAGKKTNKFLNHYTGNEGKIIPIAKLKVLVAS
ncbi:hypothetical protein PMAN_a0465 [Pseudoalteromonas marina]|nr:hypothetical protein PMAN_a0465 [Pseudoalteromonas marina]GAA76108.1 hypothetical protein P20480_2580 [Pseudoalteromonas sp. BSi20480]